MVFDRFACISVEDRKRHTVEHLGTGPLADELCWEGAACGGNWQDLVRPGAVYRRFIGNINGHHPWRWHQWDPGVKICKDR